MKNQLLLLVCCLLLTTALSAQVVINPKVGWHRSTLSEGDNALGLDGKSGFQGGLDVRLGSKAVFFYPGLHYYFQKIDIESGLLQIESESKVHSLKVPLNAGIQLTPREEMLALIVRAGVVPTFNLDNEEIDGLFSDDSLNDLYWGANIGVGIDLLQIFSLELSYEFGLSDFVEDLEAKNGFFVLSVGIKLGAAGDDLY